MDKHTISWRIPPISHLNRRFLSLPVYTLFPNQMSSIFHGLDHQILPRCRPLISRWIQRHKVKSPTEEIRSRFRHRTIQRLNSPVILFLFRFLVQVNMRARSASLKVRRLLLLDRPLVFSRILAENFWRFHCYLRLVQIYCVCFMQFCLAWDYFVCFCSEGFSSAVLDFENAEFKIGRGLV